MANTFFDFDTTINNDENLLPDDDDCIDNEDEYDALNDETFGALDISCIDDDWEQQHEQFAEIAESTKHSDHIENSLSQLVLSDESDNENIEPLTLTKSSVWSYTAADNKNDSGIFNSSAILSSLQKASKSFIESHAANDSPKLFNHINDVFQSQSPLLLPNNLVPKKICTVEELEKNLIKNSKNNVLQQQQHGILPQSPQQILPHRHMLPHPPPPHGHHFRPMMQHPIPRLPPPVIPPPPMGIPPPPNMRPMPPQIGPQRHHIMPPGLMRMIPPHFMQHNGPPRPPGLMYPPGNHQLPVNHPYNFHPPPPHNMPHPQMRNHQMAVHSNTNHNIMPQALINQQHLQHHNNYMQNNSNNRIRRDSNRDSNHRYEERDEYADMMTVRDKQWLLNIQLLQLNTGTPYFDDYYYTIYKERKQKDTHENGIINEKNGRFQNNNRQRRNSERQDGNSLTPRVYTPLQFENSLGKLQCGSVTAPRKIIDMDVVTLEKDSESPAVSKDTRKTKQLLLELEVLYNYLLKAEDIKNPLFITNMEKLREIKQKQRLKELEQAPTSEQKQEILKLFKQESEPVIENQNDYIVKVINGLLQDDKFTSFLSIRKGKMLLLRILPHLHVDTFPSQLLEIWSRVFLSLPIIGRRDTAGDNILPKLYPFVKRYVQNCSMTDIIEIITGLIEVIKQENNHRSTPLSHVGKPPLYFVLLNKFGVSALIVLLIRTEYLISVDYITESQLRDWSLFLQSWAKQAESVSKLALPLELIPIQIFNKHCNRFPDLKSEKRSVLEKYFVESQP